MRYLITIVIAALSLNAFGQVPDYVPSDGLVAWYPFNGNANDESENGNDGTVNGAILTIDRFGSANSAFSFDGIDDWIKTSNPFYQSNVNHSISIWLISNDSSIEDQTFFNTEPHTIEAFSYNYFLGSPNYINYFLGDGFNQTGSWDIAGNGGFDPIPCVNSVENWNNLTITLDNLTWRFYLNGDLCHTFIAVAPTSSLTSNVYFGNTDISVINTPFSGSMDDIGIWNRALTEVEIEALYTAEISTSGCTDALANNFNPEATLDDGTCCYVNIAQNDTTICEGDSISLGVNGAVNWTEIYLEDFEDGQAQGWYGVDGSWGGQGITNHEGNNVYHFTSDWNFFDRTIPGYPNSAGYAIEYEAYGLSFDHWSLKFRVTPNQWNYNSGDAYLFFFNQSSPSYPLNSVNIELDGNLQYTSSPLPSSYAWHTYRVEDVDDFVKYYIDGDLIYEEYNIDKSSFGDKMSFQVHKACCPGSPIPILYLDNIKVFSPTIASTFLWSTGDTTASITVTPTQTTTYWVEQTENGVTCTDEVTITVQSTGCGNSDACNFTEGDSCDIDCVFALFENDCNTGAVACGEGTVWDSETQECIVAYPSDSNFDSCVDLNDLMDLLSSYGICLEP